MNSKKVQYKTTSEDFSRVVITPKETFYIDNQQISKCQMQIVSLINQIQSSVSSKTHSEAWKEDEVKEVLRKLDQEKKSFADMHEKHKVDMMEQFEQESKTLEQLRTYMSSLNQRFEELEQKYNETSQHLQKQLQENKKLDKENSTLKAENQQLQKSLNQLKTDKVDLTQSLQIVEQDLTKIQKEQIELSDQKRVLLQSNIYRTQLQEMQSAQSKLTEKMSTLIKQNRELKTQVSQQK